MAPRTCAASRRELRGYIDDCDREGYEAFQKSVASARGLLAELE